ncbi:MAG: formate dehydrogenase accessory sulfurtransferase FdhD [Cephaloticoccus sp.]|nr:formate dehydrogenase accessory sulfurtransferase FdhD [Cephaloticoccus sp.]MCF7761211.1 formate dehydrogenase accessory sulfurtransferase FdhD [Cephaloticoccus sp.]
MSLAHSTRPTTIAHIEGTAAPVSREDLLAAEEPLEIRVNGQSVAVVMRTPGHDRELAAGFLVTEGILHHAEEVLDMVYCRGATAEPEENVLDVLLAPEAKVDLGKLTRHVFTSSSCGICSKASIEAVQAQFPPIGQQLRPDRVVLGLLPDRLREAQAGFDRTGGLHASALFTLEGKLRVVREDVGRHNALDKVVGRMFFENGLPLKDTLLLVSGRVSFEIMQKALGAGIPVVAAISAPTSAAVDFARASGQVLVGFLRHPRMNVYAGTLAD